MLKFFQQSDEIRTFLVDDLIKRGKQTLTKVSKDWRKYDRAMTQSKFRKLVELEAMLDPANLILLTRCFLELDFIADESLTTYIMAFFDMSILYALLMISDKYGLCGLELLDHASFLI